MARCYTCKSANVTVNYRATTRATCVSDVAWAIYDANVCTAELEAEQ